MTWSTKTKILQDTNTLEILTPDLMQILVGENEDLVLIYQEGASNWNLKSKEAAGAWGLKTKIAA